MDVVLRVDELHTRFASPEPGVDAVRGVSLALAAGRTVGLVGESGSGKTATAGSILRLLPEDAVTRGRVWFDGQDLLGLGRGALDRIRGSRVAMVFQDPSSALTPVLTVGEQVAEVLRVHRGLRRADARAEVERLFAEVGLADPPGKAARYPHQLSGGERQRVMIATALACDPQVLIADEPTTALDAVVQAQIVDLLRRLRDARGLAMLFITHDLGLVARVADDVAVLYRGQIVEHGPVERVFAEPRHPYTRALLRCRPRPDLGWRRLPTVSDFAVPAADGTLQAVEPDEGRLTQRARRPTGDEVLLSVRDLVVQLPGVRAVDGVSLQIRRGETLGLVGASGSGKTTLTRAVLRLIPATSGSVWIGGQDFLALRGAALRAARRRVQVVFQDPAAALDPRQTVVDALTEPMAVHGIGSPADRRDRAAELLREVGLSTGHLRRYPHELSGGQQQRVGIARALAPDPDLLICDEPVSSIDVSLRAQVLNLLIDLQDARGLTCLFVSHDLDVVEWMADRVAVMRGGRVVEEGPVSEVWRSPRHPYTRQLLAAVRG